MIALYLLAAHMVGDYVLSNRWQAATKLHDRNVRLRHVAVYCVPFVPIAAIYANRDGSRLLAATAFLLWLAIFHFATDSRRFHSTLGDWIVHRRYAQVWSAIDPLVRRRGDRFYVEISNEDGCGVVEGKVLDEHPDPLSFYGRLDLEPNPWTPIPLLIDQTLHLCQLALLGGLLLQ